MGEMDEIYLHSHLVLNTYIGRKKRNKKGQLLKPLTVLTPLTTTKVAKMLSLRGCMAYLGIVNREKIYIRVHKRHTIYLSSQEKLYIQLSLPENYIYLS